MRRPLSHLLLAAVAVCVFTPAASAQSLEAHGFADLGMTLFTASESFEAVLGSSAGVVFGGGGGVVLPQNIFVDVRASRFKKDGSRVVIADGETFDLGIADTITITPLELTGGYRFGRARDSVRPYAGGGISWYRYQESDEFATGDEAVDETFTGFHLLGGAEFRVHRYVGIAGEIAWSRIPDALGQEPLSVGARFGETDLGGTTFRVKLVIGR
jgi:opacity protein-like surface antigen